MIKSSQQSFFDLLNAGIKLENLLLKILFLTKCIHVCARGGVYECPLLTLFRIGHWISLELELEFQGKFWKLNPGPLSSPEYLLLKKCCRVWGAHIFNPSTGKTKGGGSRCP